MKGYYLQNSDSLPEYFDDIIDSSGNPPYSYRMDLKIHFASESGYNVFHILCEALFYMKYGNLESYHQDRTEGIMLAIRYLQNLLQQGKIKIRIFSVYFDKRNKTDFAKLFTQPSEINLFLEAATLEWNNLKERRKIKEKENQLGGIYFPYEKPEQDPDSEEFWFYYYDGISISHPDDPFWDEPENSEDNDTSLEFLFYGSTIKYEK